jgi:hypothetical protein
MTTDMCVTSDHRVLLANGMWKAVREVSEGDVLSVPFLKAGASTDGTTSEVGYILTLDDGTRIEVALDGKTVLRTQSA